MCEKQSEADSEYEGEMLVAFVSPKPSAQLIQTGRQRVVVQCAQYGTGVEQYYLMVQIFRRRSICQSPSHQ